MILLSMLALIAAAPNNLAAHQSHVPNSETIIVTSDNLRVVHNMTDIIKVEKRTFCEGRRVFLEATSNIMKTSTERNATFILKGNIDGQLIDFSKAEAILHEKKSSFNVGFKTNCLNSMMTIEIYAYADGDIRNSKVQDIYIDLESGYILDNPRRSPPIR